MFKKLTATLLLLSTNALAGLPPTTIKAQNGTKSGFFNLQTPAKQVTKVDGTTALIETGSQNLVENPGFEALSIATGWTASGGTLAKTTTSGQFRQESGKAAASWDSSAASQTLSGTAFTVTSSMNAEVSVWIKISSGSATHKLQVTDGTNVVAEVSITQDTSGFVKTSLNFATVAGTSYTPRLISVASNEPTIYVDDFYGGAATNIGSVAQAEMFGTVTMNSCSGGGLSTSSTSYTTVSSSGCSYTATGKVTSPPSNTFGATIPTLPPGEYEIEADGFVQNNGNDACYVRFTDGTNTSSEQYFRSTTSTIFPKISGRIRYTAAQTNLNLQLQLKAGGTNTCSIFAVSQFRLKRFPLESEIAYRPELQALSWSGYHDASYSNWNFTSTGSFADPASNTSNGNDVTELTNRNFGTVTSYVSGARKLPGIVITPKKTGRFHVCAITGPADAGASGGSFQLNDITNSKTIAEAAVTDASTNTSVSLCGILDVPNLNAITLAVQGKKGAAGTMLITSYNTTTRMMNWSIFALDQNIPAPVLVGSNSTVQLDSANGNGSTNTAIQRFTNVNLNQGSAITYADSATLGASFTINMAGMYCVQWSSSKGSGTSNIGFSVNSSTLTTSIGAMSYAQGKRHFTSLASASGQAHASWCGYLNTGDILRPHNDGGTYDTSNSTIFSISKVD